MRHFGPFLLFLPTLFTYGHDAGSTCISEPLSCPITGVRVARAADNNTTMTPTQKEIIQTTANTIGTLAEAKLETMAEKFLKIGADKFIRILKCFSIAGNVLSLFIQSENADTKQIITKLQNGFDKLTNQMNTQFANLEMVVREQFFDLSVYNPVQAATKRMNDMLQAGALKNQLSRALFVSAYEQANMDIVAEHILKGSKQRFLSTFKATDYSERIFNSTKDTLTIVFLQTYVVRAFLISLASECMNGTVARLVLEKEANKTRVDFSKVITEVTDNFYREFFPGTAKENVVRKVVDKHGGQFSNCELAEAIKSQLRALYPWRHYTVIVSNGVSGSISYYQFGYLNRRIFEENYNGKNVIVFMNTPNFIENAKKYKDGNYRNEILKTRMFTTSLETLATFIVNGSNFSQMAIFRWGNDHCWTQSHPNSTDAFDQKVAWGVPGSGVAIDVNVFYVVSF